MGVILKKPIKEIKSVGTISQEQFLKLFANAGKVDVILNSLDFAVRKPEQNTDEKSICEINKEQKQKDIQNICKQILVHSKKLAKIYNTEENFPELSKAVKIVLAQNKQEIYNKITDIYGIEGCKIIMNFSIKLSRSECSDDLIKDKAMKSLIEREYKFFSRSDPGQFQYPHAKFNQHMVFLIL